MSEVAVRKILREFGLTEKEMDIYIFLAKQDILKGGEIAKQTKTTKALVYRILRSLQAKGIVESTVEFPARFSAVPFENVIDLYIKSRLNEVARIKEDKNTLLTYWKMIDKPKSDVSVEKFALIEGKQKIYHKQSQLFTKTKVSFSSVTTSRNLAQADYFGVFDQRFRNQIPEISFRFLIGAQKQNLAGMKKIFKQIATKIPNVDVRVPELGLGRFSQMAIRDNEEALFQIAGESTNSKERKKDLFLWTNCKSLIDAFSLVFEEMWSSSTGVLTKINELQTGNLLTRKIQFIDDSQTAYTKYRDALQSARKEIIMIISSDSPSAIAKTKQLLNNSVQKDVVVRLMFSVTSNNKDIAQELLKKYRVRHVPVGYLGMTLIDDRHLFQFKTSDHEPEMSLENTFYTNDYDYLIRTKKILNDKWEHAQMPQVSTLESILRKVDPALSPFPYGPLNLMGSPFVIEQIPPGTLTEKDVLQKMVAARKICNDNVSMAIDRRFGSIGLAVIYPPKYMKLPEIMIIADKIEKSSSLGEEDAIIFLSKLQTTKGFVYVPVAIIGDNPKAHDFWKKMNIFTPAGQNTRLIKKDEVEIKIHGNTLFVGWTVPISLYPPKLILPPGCMLIEGYGDVKTTAYTVVPPSGYKIVREENYLDAFVTFFHPASKYSGPGTDGYLIRDSIITIYPPKTQDG